VAKTAKQRLKRLREAGFPLPGGRRLLDRKAKFGAAAGAIAQSIIEGRAEHEGIEPENIMSSVPDWEDGVDRRSYRHTSEIPKGPLTEDAKRLLEVIQRSFAEED
jgi:hypothetical protein